MRLQIQKKYMVPCGTMLMLLTAILFYGIYPPLTWGLLACLICVNWILICRSAEADIINLVKTFIGPSMVALFVSCMAILLYGFVSPFDRSVFLDQGTYYREAIEVAKSWSQGTFPTLENKGSLPYLGTLHTGYHRFLAAAFLFFGDRPFVGIALNLCSIPVLICGIWILSRELALSSLIIDNRKIRQVVLLTVCLACLHPGIAFWVRVMQKDLMLSAIVVVWSAMLVHLLRRFTVLNLVCCVSLGYVVFIFRIYACLGILLGICAYVCSCLRLTEIRRVGLVAIVVGCVCLYTYRGEMLLAQLVHSSFGILPAVDLNGHFLGLKWLAVAFPRFFLSPYAWIASPDGMTATYGQFPGMWGLYIVVYPLFIAGCLKVFQLDLKLSLILMIALCFSYLIFAFAFQGEASRQRFYLEFLMVVIAGFSVYATKRQLFWSFLSAYVLIGIFAGFQTALYLAKY